MSLEILSIRRVNATGGQVEVRCRLPGGSPRTYTLSGGYLDPGDATFEIKGLGQKGANALRAALAEYNRAYNELDTEGKLKQLLAEATELFDRCQSEVNEAVARGAAVLSGSNPDSFDAWSIEKAIERWNDADRRRSQLIGFIHLTLGEDTLMRWHIEDKAAKAAAQAIEDNAR